MKVSILKDYHSIYEWFNEVDLSQPISCDTELVDKNWLTMQIAGISFCDGKRVCYVDLLCMETRPNQLYDGEDCFETICLLQDIIKSCSIIFHNAPFDLMVFKKYNIPEPQDIFCTMTAAHLIDENQHKGLKFLAQKYLGITETVDFDDAISDGFHSSKFYKYATNDAVWTYQLYEIFKEELKKQKLEELFYGVEMPFQFCLRDLAINGVLVDKENLLELQGQLREEIKDLQTEMFNVGGVEYYYQKHLFDSDTEIIPELNLNSPDQLSKFIIKDLGLKLTEKTKPSKLHPKGQYSTKNSVLERFRNQHKFVELLLDYRAASKMLNSFLEPLPNFIQADGRIRASFNNCVTVTGRLSSSRPNLQQLPKDNTGPVPIRQCLIAPPGKVLLCADYSGQELRVLAHVSKDPTMIKAFENNIDVHLLIANIFFELNIPDEVLKTNHPDYESYRNKFKNERDKIKAVNFGLAYGKTSVGFAKDWNVPEQEAKKFIDDYFKRFPLIKKSMDICSQKTRQQKGIRNLTGRIRRFEYIDDKALRMAYNFLVQGPSADLMKKAASNVRNLCLQHNEWKCLLVLSVHDELVYEIKKEYVDEALPLIKYEMESAGNQIGLCLVMPVDINWGCNYAESKP